MPRESYRTRDQIRAMVEQIHATGFLPTIGSARQINPKFSCDGIRFNRVRDEWYTETGHKKPTHYKVPVVSTQKNRTYTTTGIRVTARSPEPAPDDDEPAVWPETIAGSVAWYDAAVRNFGEWIIAKYESARQERGR